MREIKKVLICGIGAIGSIYANYINQYDSKSLKILVDEKRLEKYTKAPQIFNGKPLNLEYVLAQNTDYKADLIIIATKLDGLDEAVKNIKNFVKEDTIIMSLLNGVTSEERIAQIYGWKHTLLSYFIGHSAMRKDNNITYDGHGYLVFGIKDAEQTDIEDIETVKNYFDKIKIPYKTPENMMRSYWTKFMLNVGVNQPSAIMRFTFGQMQNNEKFKQLAQNIFREVQTIAEGYGISDTEGMVEECMESLGKMMSEGKTSMLQDIEAGRKTEVDMFAGVIIELGKKYNIPTPYNKVMKEMIEALQQ